MKKELIGEINRFRKIMGLSEAFGILPGFITPEDEEKHKKRLDAYTKWKNKGAGDGVKQYELSERDFNEVYDELQGQLVLTTVNELKCARAGGRNCKLVWYDYKDNIIGLPYGVDKPFSIDENGDIVTIHSVKRVVEFLNNYKIGSEKTITTWEEWINSPLWEGTHLFYSKDNGDGEVYKSDLSSGMFPQATEEEKEKYWNERIKPNYGGIVYKTI